MPSDSTNRLDSFWPRRSSDGQPSALPAAKQLAAKTEALLASAGRGIAEHPRTALTLAATLGAALGWFIKRK